MPGGLGVFESLIVVIAAGRVPTERLLGALVVYRGFYYLLPLMLATGALGAQELLRRRAWLKKASGLAAEIFPALLIPLLTLAVFASGAVLLFSGALPALPERLRWLRSLPLPLVEISHFLGSVAGMGLLLLARGLQRRLDAAYLLTVGLLGFGILASLLKGLDYEEALILSLVLAALLPFRHSFFRRASLFSERFSTGWVAAIAVVVITSIWLGLFAFRHVEYSDQLWWTVSFQGHAPRFLRATIGALGLAFFAAGAWLLRPASPSVEAGGGWPAAVPGIVARSPNASANLALTGDKRFLMSESADAFIMYGVAGQSHVAMGDPIGPETQWPELMWQFRQTADRYGNRAVFYEVGPSTLHHYLDINMTLLKLGEEARVPLTDFSLEGGRKKNLRYIHRKMQKEGCRFAVVPVDKVPEILGALKTVSDAWLADFSIRLTCGGFRLPSCGCPAASSRLPTSGRPPTEKRAPWTSCGTCRDLPAGSWSFCSSKRCVGAGIAAVAGSTWAWLRCPGWNPENIHRFGTGSERWRPASANTSTTSRGFAATRRNSTRYGGRNTWPLPAGFAFPVPWPISSP